MYRKEVYALAPISSSALIGCVLRFHFGFGKLTFTRIALQFRVGTEMSRPEKRVNQDDANRVVCKISPIFFSLFVFFFDSFILRMVKKLRYRLSQLNERSTRVLYILYMRFEEYPSCTYFIFILVTALEFQRWSLTPCRQCAQSKNEF